MSEENGFGTASLNKYSYADVVERQEEEEEEMEYFINNKYM